jgi:hypothetical protein
MDEVGRASLLVYWNCLKEAIRDTSVCKTDKVCHCSIRTQENIFQSEVKVLLTQNKMEFLILKPEYKFLKHSGYYLKYGHDCFHINSS